LFLEHEILIMFSTLASDHKNDYKELLHLRS